jgi:hypothetical protein
MGCSLCLSPISIIDFEKFLLKHLDQFSFRRWRNRAPLANIDTVNSVEDGDAEFNLLIALVVFFDLDYDHGVYTSPFSG